MYTCGRVAEIDALPVRSAAIDVRGPRSAPHASTRRAASRSQRPKGHPTADVLVRKVRKALPTVSHATVYRDVQELLRAGLIGTLQREDLELLLS